MVPRRGNPNLGLTKYRRTYGHPTEVSQPFFIFSMGIWSDHMLYLLVVRERKGNVLVARTIVTIQTEGKGDMLVASTIYKNNSLAKKAAFKNFFSK